MSRLELIASAQEAGQRIDLFVSGQEAGLTRSAVQGLCEQGLVAARGKPVAKNYRLREGDTITVEIPAPRLLEAQAQDIPLSVVYEDAHLLVVNKPKGMVVHPAAGNEDGTLVNALLYHCNGSLSGINGVVRPGIVHRIDKDTSGLLVVAKNDRAHLSLAGQIKEHSCHRRYEAVVYYNVKQDEGVVDAPIGRHPADRKRMAVTDKHSRQARTHYRVLTRYEGFTHLALELETGRTHQIRVHMAHIGHPVAGDGVYGPHRGIKYLEGQCLHARTLGFVHPVTGDYMEFTSPLPDYFNSFLARLRPMG